MVEKGFKIFDEKELNKENDVSVKMSFSKIAVELH